MLRIPSRLAAQLLSLSSVHHSVNTYQQQWKSDFVGNSHDV